MADWKDRLKAQGCPEEYLADPMKAMSWLQSEKDRAEASLKAEQNRPLKFRLNPETGTVMVTGLRQFPVSLYRSEWAKILDEAFVRDLKAYIVSNNAALETAEIKGKAAKAAAATTATGTNG